MERCIVGRMEPEAAQSGEVPRSCAYCENGSVELHSGACVACERCTESDGVGFVHLAECCRFCDDAVTYELGVEGQDERGARVLFCSTACAQDWSCRSSNSNAAAGGFDRRVGPGCVKCGLPALLHGERCEEVA